MNPGTVGISRAVQPFVMTNSELNITISHPCLSKKRICHFGGFSTQEPSNVVSAHMGFYDYGPMVLEKKQNSGPSLLTARAREQSHRCRDCAGRGTSSCHWWYAVGPQPPWWRCHEPACTCEHHGSSLTKITETTSGRNYANPTLMSGTTTQGIERKTSAMVTWKMKKKSKWLIHTPMLTKHNPNRKDEQKDSKW